MMNETAQQGHLSAASDASLPPVHVGPLVVGVDWPSGSPTPLHWSVDSARSTRAKVYLVHAISPWLGIEMAVPPFDFDSYRALVIEKVDQWADIDDLDLEKRVLEDNPAAALLLIAEEVDAAMIVVGAHAQGNWTPPILGSVTSKILHAARVPIAVIPDASPPTEARIVVVGVDGSSHSERALRWAARSDLTRGRDIHAVCVLPLDPCSEPPILGAPGASEVPRHMMEATRRMTEKVVQETGASVIADFPIGLPLERLVEIGNDASLIVLGKSGHGALAQTILGSTGRAVATHAQVPVIVVP